MIKIGLHYLLGRIPAHRGIAQRRAMGVRSVLFVQLLTFCDDRYVASLLRAWNALYLISTPRDVPTCG